MRRRLPAVTLALAVACGTGGGPPSDPLPGAPPMDATTTAAIRAASASRPAGERPRTRHLRPDGSPRYTNRLVLEASPYLQQHAHNPVDWYPWGDEAFETARRLGRPVLLSVGYSTCHWCHVMEEESFEDEEIARYLNEHYVAIKVDREERPDVDAVYMSAVQALTGGGGWPMTVWLTPDRQPFYGGTYFPARDGDRGVRSGFLTVLQTVAKRVWLTNPRRVADAAADLAADDRRQRLAAAPGGATPPDAAALARRRGGDARAVRRRRRRLRRQRRSSRATCRSASCCASTGGPATRTRGGWPRSRSSAWPRAASTIRSAAASIATRPTRSGCVPHFEKMLYDNALLALAYLEAYQATGRADVRRRGARRPRATSARDMTSPEGGFYSATDADSPGPDGHREEGLVLHLDAGRDRRGARAGRGAARPRLVRRHARRQRRRAQRPPHASATRRRRATSWRSPAPTRGTLVADARHVSTRHARVARRRSATRRSSPPGTGSMISAYARAALVLGDPGYATTARRAPPTSCSHPCGRTDASSGA